MSFSIEVIINSFLSSSKILNKVFVEVILLRCQEGNVMLSVKCIISMFMYGWGDNVFVVST